MDRDSRTLESVQAEIDGLHQQVVSVNEHRSRIMVLLSERSLEIADLTAELGRAKTEALRHLEDAQSTARQLRRTNDKLNELAEVKLSLENDLHRVADELASARLELSATKTHLGELDREHRVGQSELVKLRQEADATRRTLEAQQGAWEQERTQLSMALSGLTLEIQSEHQAARVLERRWIRSPTEPAADQPRQREGNGIDLRIVQAEGLQREVETLREERAQLSARVHELEREAGAARELARVQQELRNALVEKNLLERKLEDAEARDLEREELRARITDLQQNRLDADLARAEVERLRLRLYKAPLHSGTYATNSGTHRDDSTTGTRDELETEIENLVLQTGARSVVVADQGGFPVATLGSTADSEKLAAVAGEADRFSRQASQLLELAEVTQFTLQDRNGTIAHYRFFAIDDDVMSVAVIGPNIPEESALDRVVTAMIQQLTAPRERTVRTRNTGSK